MSEYVTEKKFVVAEGSDGKLYFFIDAKSEHPKAPQIIYDGNDHAVFLRNENQKIILDYIHPDVRTKLCNSHKVMIVETLLDNIKESYSAEMKLVKKIPVDWGLIGLTSWDKATGKQP